LFRVGDQIRFLVTRVPLRGAQEFIGANSEQISRIQVK